MVHEERRGHRVRVDDAGEAHPPVRELLDDPDVGQEIEAEAAVRLGDGHAEEPELAHLVDDLRREAVLPFELGGDGGHLLVDEAPDRVDDLLAHVVVCVFHCENDTSHSLLTRIS